MRVLFATGVYPPGIGGPATYVQNLAGAAAARGLGVEVVAYGREEPPPEPFPVHWAKAIHREISRKLGPEAPGPLPVVSLNQRNTFLGGEIDAR